MNFTTRSSRTRLSSFLDLLSSPHATIAPHVRQIILDLSKERFSIPKSVFVRIGALYALQSITLIEYTPGDHPRVDDIVTVLGSLVKLKHLELNYCSLESFIQLRDIVCACRGLEWLCILRLHPAPTAPQTPLYVPLSEPFLCPPGLRVLKVGNCIFGEQLFNWLASCVPSLILSSMWIDSSTVRLCGHFTRALGSKLEHLSIHFGKANWYRPGG